MSYGLIGHNISYSYSPIIHKLIGKYDYQLWDIPPNNLPSFINEVEFMGANVTIPYKEDILKFALADDIATSIGATNTIYKIDGHLFATNTDYDGFLYLINLHKLNLKNKNILILGSGGASKAVEKVCKDKGCKTIFIASRTKSSPFIPYNRLPKNIDIIINATPLGSKLDDVPIIQLKQFNQCEVVIDLIYNPMRSALLLEAERHNLKAINGLSMLVGQGIRSGEYFINQSLTISKENILKKLINQTQNISLVGMSGSGKTTVGKYISQILQKSFVDIDLEIEKKYNMSITEIFRSFGETRFREIESAVIYEIMQKSNQVISIGGGGVLNTDNCKFIKSNSIVVNISRSLQNIDFEDLIQTRPLLNSKNDWEKLYMKRKVLYDNIADINVQNDWDIDIVSQNLIKKVGKFNEKYYFN